jgi:small basic protein (TIGR04137 family)
LDFSPAALRFGRAQTPIGNAFEKDARPATLPAHFRSTSRSRIMSQHRSLKGASTITAKRNVLKRFERVELLKKRGQWKDTSKVIGLPKTKPDV